jgi:4-hydroxythreonine-4-phosphate dehydrogenase
MTDTARPILLTMGDAAGIGPEILVSAFQRGQADGCVVVGDPAVLRRAAAVLKGDRPIVAVIDHPGALSEVPPGCLPVCPAPGLPAGLATLPWGRVDARCGAAALACIDAAVHWVRKGAAAAIVTAPVHKEALAAAGSRFPGHTELLQALATDSSDASNPPPVRMMLANEQLRVVLVTIHVGLREAIELLDFGRVLETIRIAHRAAAGWGQPRPRIAIAGLNPHAGEGGLFGDEEQRFIGPAVQAARAEGIEASGPYAPDTVFMRARHDPPGHPGEFDIVVAMTHDHGLIPVKYLGVEQGVNVTLGLPFVRTSPDHGTAFDIAGRGVADPASLISAIGTARRMVGAAC